jgi:DNA-binding NarL/FixJ family response regulator
MKELTVLIADDHELIRRGIRDLLSARRQQWRVVAEACEGEDAVRKALHLKPDVAILDFSMPLMTGSEASSEITKKLPDTGVLILTMHDSDQVIHQVLRSGAHGLVLKSDSDSMLLEAVEAVGDKRLFFSGSVSDVVLGQFRSSMAARSMARNCIDSQLTTREIDIVRLIAQGQTNKEIAWLLQISTRTVESHRININRKFGFRSVADLVRYAIRNGIATEA